MRKQIFACAALLLMLAPAPGAAGPDELSQLFQALQGRISGQRARDYATRLWTHEKWFTLPAWRRAAETARTIMTERGFDEADLLGTPADGVTKSCAWTNPIGWDVKQATLEVVEPPVPDEYRYLCDYQDNPTSLNAWSAPTPPEGIETELVLMETADPEELGRLDARGKIVLTSVYTRGMKKQLGRFGILGFVGDSIEEATAGFVEANQWLNGWSDMPGGWWLTGHDSRNGFGFSISRKKADYLRSLLRQGTKVKVRARVDSRYYTDGQLPYVVGLVRGSDPEGDEILVTGHINEWGANDNSAGVSAILEAVGTLNDLIGTGKIPRPRRSLRVLLGGEMYGSLPYVEKNLRRLQDKTVAAVCLDTGAEDYDLATTAVNLYLNPNACPTFTDALFPEVLRRYYARYAPERRWSIEPFLMGTDTYFCEPMIGVPTNLVYMNAGSRLHHNSLDTIEKVDPRSLRELSFIAAAYLHSVADAGMDDIPFIAGLTLARARIVIADKAREMELRAGAARDGAALGQALADGLEAIGYGTGLQETALGSIARLAPAGRRTEARKLLAPYVRQAGEMGGLMKRQFRETVAARAAAGALKVAAPVRAEGAWEKEAASLVPRRFQPGTLFLEEVPPSEWREIRSSPHWWSRGNWAAAAYWWIDGRRNVNEIKKLCELEAGKPMEGFDLIAYLRFLEKYGYVKLAGPSRGAD
ncbi:MAG TPA: M28 family peptidase [Candidatus Aminicenantes bacterium]|nr:M28 family peptidase [Candidatus Aminicenantes bacterium]HRY65837.1 M28 family peptidase [Candidatus Aminicenantes bacterium]HRZ72837.1 M28 family peptidase [Candidatus Aminicenantes bacterium]